MKHPRKCITYIACLEKPAFPSADRRRTASGPYLFGARLRSSSRLGMLAVSFTDAATPDSRVYEGQELRPCYVLEVRNRTGRARKTMKAYPRSVAVTTQRAIVRPVQARDHP
eukprot:jgi/Botrbrau1/461/Bobra.110_2s0105.1